MWRYRFFDGVLASVVPLALPACPHEQSPDWRFSVRPLEPRSNHRRVHGWGEHGCWVFTVDAGDRYLLRLEDRLTFEIAPDGRDLAAPPGVTPGTLNRLLLNYALPVAVGRTGPRVLHGALVGQDQRAYALIGPSGAGKSTLAAALALRGLELLGDDCLLVRSKGNRWSAVASYRSLRLWDDSALGLGPGLGSLRGPGVRVGGKLHLHPQGPAAAPPGGDCRDLAGIYILGSRRTAPERAPAVVRSASVGEALKALLGSQFRLDPTDRELLAAEFRDLARLAAAVPIRWLDYRRSFSALDDVCRVLIEDLRVLHDQPRARSPDTCSSFRALDLAHD